jgi:hypothetical protein
MKKILVAEDNDSNYVLMTYLLKKDFEFDHSHWYMKPLKLQQICCRDKVHLYK